MIHTAVDENEVKGWFIGPWNSKVPTPVGYANQGLDQEHYHAQMYEIYLVARGQSTAVIDGEAVHLEAGHMLVVEPGEVHTFIESSADYLHFVIHTPFVEGDKFLAD